MSGAHAGASKVRGDASAWVEAHEALSRLARERARADAEEGRWLLAAWRSAAHVHLGFGSFGEYVERLFGYRPRSTQEKLRVAEALEELPAIAGALAQGALNWSSARELTRVAVAETEVEWLEVAQGLTVHQLEALVADKSPGDSPSSTGRISTRCHVLRFEVAAETLALFREAMSELRRSTGASLDDDSALQLMARQILGGPSDEGRSSYQIALNVCQECGKGAQLSRGELVPVGVEAVAMAECDGQHLGLLGGPGANESAHLGATSTKESAHVGAASANESAPMGATALEREASRAKQTIPPRTRRAVLRRDQKRCVVPGCRNGRYLDLHHIVLRSEGGGNDPDNLVTLCGAHHRAAHRGELHVEGSVARGLRFEHADGSDYGRAPGPRAIATQARAFAALRGLGFREGEVRGALAQVQKSNVGAELGIEKVLREALAKLTLPQPR